ncbi:MAG: HDOD domain-containing protein [Spirochaetes bacterium]|nr:HDOD domain-containing protein [Spirochaetota bacterium]
METKQISKDEINFKIENGSPVVFRDYKIPMDNENYYVDVLGEFLKAMGKEKIFDHLGYSLREIINNAKKANTKRVFFMDENLDIADPVQYEKGMKYFKDKAFGDLEYYLGLQEKYNLYVQVYFHIKDPFLNIIVSNNTPILKQEQEKIKNRVAKARTYNSVDDAYMSILDDSEGAGLGIVILILILRKIGISDRNFAIAVDKDVTHVRIAVPISLVTEEEAEFISDAIIKEIDTIPQIPEHIVQLTNLLKDEDVDFKKITLLIKKDPALMMEILKMANSVYYKRLNKIEKIDHAVSMMGVKGLEYILQSYGAKQALKQKYAESDLAEIWRHSTEIAQIASILCDKFNLSEDSEDAYIGGLLHNVGKIVVKALHADTIENITNLCMQKNISVNLLGDLLEGTNYSLIGAKMAEKWQLPEKIISIIRYQHSPYRCPEDVKEISKMIYLSHMISSQLHKGNDQYIFSDNILEELYIESEEALTELTNYVKNQLS